MFYLGYLIISQHEQMISYITSVITDLSCGNTSHINDKILNQIEWMRFAASAFDSVSLEIIMSPWRAERVSGKVESALLRAVGPLGSGHSKAGRFPRAVHRVRQEYRSYVLAFVYYRFPKLIFNSRGTTQGWVEPGVCRWRSRLG